jgi:vacuolar-type H+-ATPase subunit E/Vma4
MIKDVLDAAFEQIKKKTSMKQYKKILTRLAVDGILTLDAEEVVLVFPKGQQSIVTSNELTKLAKDEIKKNLKITISKDTIDATGGVVIKSSDGKRWVNNTFEHRFERFEREIRDKAAKILFVGKRW